MVTLRTSNTPNNAINPDVQKRRFAPLWRRLWQKLGGKMKSPLFLILLLSSVTAYADNSTIEGLIASYEDARERGTLVEWQAENRHPHMFKELTELQRKWKKVSDCHNETQEKAHREKDAMRPRHEKVKITEATECLFIL